MTEEKKEKKRIKIELSFINGTERVKYLTVDKDFDFKTFETHFSEVLSSNNKWLNYVESDNPPKSFMINLDEITCISIYEESQEERSQTIEWVGDSRPMMP